MPNVKKNPKKWLVDISNKITQYIDSDNISDDEFNRILTKAKECIGLSSDIDVMRRLSNLIDTLYNSYSSRKPHNLSNLKYKASELMRIQYIRDNYSKALHKPDTSVEKLTCIENACNSLIYGTQLESGHKKAWIYKLQEDIEFPSYYLSDSAKKPIIFENKWVTIKDNIIIVRKGYVWDGCSPKWDIFGLFTIGTPDGRLRHGKPITYYASCVHDVFCQYKDHIPITRENTVRIFDQMLLDRGFKLHRLYVWFINKFGPQKFLGDK